MNKLIINKGNHKEEIIIGKRKFIVGENEYRKSVIMRYFYEFDDHLSESEYSEAYDNGLKLYIDSKQLTPKNTAIFRIDNYFDLTQELKMQSKSIILKYLESILNNQDYINQIDTMKYVLESICIQMNDDSEIKVRPQSISPNFVAKMLIPFITLEDEVCNEYDLEITDYICLQIRILNRVLSESNTNNIVVIDTPFITNLIYEELLNINNAFVIAKCNYIEPEIDIEDCLLVNEDTLDLANDQLIFDVVCSNTLFDSNIQKGRDYMNKLINEKKIYSIKHAQLLK